MKGKISKTEAKKKIDEFFLRDDFSPKEIKKIKKLAMRHNIKLRNYRRKFCKKCLTKLKGKTRVSKTHKTIECEYCGYRNKFRINQTN